MSGYKQAKTVSCILTLMVLKSHYFGALVIVCSIANIVDVSTLPELCAVQTGLLLHLRQFSGILRKTGYHSKQHGGSPYLGLIRPSYVFEMSENVGAALISEPSRTFTLPISIASWLK